MASFLDECNRHLTIGSSAAPRPAERLDDCRLYCDDLGIPCVAIVASDACPWAGLAFQMLADLTVSLRTNHPECLMAELKTFIDSRKEIVSG
jgi:hypothetical protein